MNVEENKALYDYLLFKKTYKPKVEIVYQQIDYRYRATINKNK